MKKLFLSALMLLISTTSYASTAGRIEQIFNATAVSGTSTTVTSRTFNVGSIYRMGYWFKAAKAATPEGSAITMTVQGSWDDVSGDFATMQTVIPLDQYTLTTTPMATAGTVSPVPAMKYVRFVAQGATGNATGTTVTAYLFTQEQS